MAEIFAANPELIEAVFSRTPAPDPPLPAKEPWRSRAIIGRSAAKRGINVCFLGADAPTRIRPPVDDGAA